MVKVLIFGDSIAWGAFDLEKGGWVERLKTYYLATFETEEVGVYNLGISSNDTRGLLFGLEKSISIFDAVEPEEYILLFAIGSNDARYIGKRDQPYIPIGEFKNNLEKIVELAKSHATKIVFTGLTIVNEQLTKPWRDDLFWENSDLKKYNDIIEELCQERGLSFIPLWDVLTEADLPDGLHPNAQGHIKIYQRVKDYLQKLL
ncbi:MAG: GDSL-type esterase/lipase family protein [Patescibacteria group bacterium]|jgi:lysophospholipase L1-like esterase